MATKSTNILRAVLLVCVFALVLTAVGVTSTPTVVYSDKDFFPDLCRDGRAVF